jgi:asparagine synthase (glutamine-hydrolysing)
MSVLFGRLKERGASVQIAELHTLAAPTRKYSTSDAAFSVHEHIGMGLQPYFSHQRSEMETCPLADPHGNILCLDGRIDNFRELAALLDMQVPESSDSEIVMAAFLRWGKNCFSRLIGDWGLALWSIKEQTLYLARDHAGTRTLYYSTNGTCVVWATYLEAFTTKDNELRLSKDYAAVYLSHSLVRDLTPYEGVRSVRPGHYVRYRSGSVSQEAHWSPLVPKAIRYSNDADYDAHFLSVFGQAVARRTGPGAPILAQLSGGMDSTSIVCMSDHLRQLHSASSELLETISFFDDSEASLDERRYFSITESRRGKVGTHLEIAFGQRTFDLPINDRGSYPIPGCDGFSLRLEETLSRLIWERGFRVVLSGIGGDEMLGGIPNGTPELCDYLVSGELGTLFQRAIAWSLPDRHPLLDTLYRTCCYTCRLYTSRNPKKRAVPAWISREMRIRCLDLDKQANTMPRRLGASPHSIENALTWWHVMETLPHLTPQLYFRPEYRYPMLDKDLVEYVFSIPPDQLVRPGRRRSMMRRALGGIVPTEVLERRRKAFQLRAPMNAIRFAHSRLEMLLSDSMLAEAGFIDVRACRSALRGIVNGDATCYQGLLRTIAYELWLRARAQGRGVL